MQQNTKKAIKTVVSIGSYIGAYFVVGAGTGLALSTASIALLKPAIGLGGAALSSVAAKAAMVETKETLDMLDKGWDSIQSAVTNAKDSMKQEQEA